MLRGNRDDRLLVERPRFHICGAVPPTNPLTYLIHSCRTGPCVDSMRMFGISSCAAPTVMRCQSQFLVIGLSVLLSHFTSALRATGE